MARAPLLGQIVTSDTDPNDRRIRTTRGWEPYTPQAANPDEPPPPSATPLPTPIVTANSKQLADADEYARNQQRALQLEQEALRANAHVSTGFMPYGLPAIGGLLTSAIGGINPSIGTMESLATRTAPFIRAPGQRLTQMEWLKNLGAVVSPRNPFATNQRIVQFQQNFSAYSAARAAHMRHWVEHTDGGLDGEADAWDRFAGQHFDPKTGAFSQTPLSQRPAAPPPANDSDFQLLGITPQHGGP